MLYTTDNITAYLWSKLIGSVTTSDARIDSENNTKEVIILKASMRVIISLILPCLTCVIALTSSIFLSIQRNRQCLVVDHNCVNELSLSMIKIIIILFESRHILFLDNLLNHLK